ncbi:MAG: type I 3-dehydroquinate dehydratase [Acidobacteria bacterium]|nr:type I 3-dehydroquinate dehydratase [Acidobacteriota bacterium]
MTPALLCETVTGATMAELIAARDAAASAGVVDMVELRLDGVRDLDVAGALDAVTVPVVATCRPVWEGGRFDGSEEERRGVLTRALAHGARYVDIEWQAGFDDMIAANQPRVVVSSHDFTGVPADLATRARAMRSTGAALIKVAVSAARLSDSLPLLEVAKQGDAVVVAMGDAGVPSRLLASRFGSRWTFAGQNVAPGQIPATRMVGEFRFRAVGAHTAVYGVVGNNVMHSVSPAMHNAAFAAAGRDAVYVPLCAADFADFLAFAEALDLAGASVTIPFKRDALDASIASDALARRVGAANTVRRVPDGWEATNTDLAGFLEPLEAAWGADLLGQAATGPAGKTGPTGKMGIRVSVLGAGGVSRAVVVALKSRGACVTVHARRAAQAQALAESLDASVGPWPPDAGSWDVLVNCTPLGSASAPDSSPMAGEALDGRFVYDLTYQRGESPLMRDARQAGLSALDGRPMLVAQAERQFEWWTGMRPGPGVMREAADGGAARPMSGMAGTD